MSELLNVVINGLSVGSLYGLLAVAIVLPWRVTNVANFAQGNIGMVGAFLSFLVVSKFGGGAVGGMLLSVAAGVAIGAILYMATVAITPNARLTEAGHINLTLRTFGLDVTLLAVAGIFWAAGEPYQYPSIAPSEAITFMGFSVTPATVLVLALVIGIVVLLHFVFSRTLVGLRLQAVAENPLRAELAGISATVLSLVAWAVAGGLSALAAVLYTPFTYLTVDMMMAFLLKAFTAVLLGGRDNWFGVLAGGLCLGVIEALIGNYISYMLQPAIAFIVLAMVLVWKPEGVITRVRMKRV